MIKLTKLAVKRPVTIIMCLLTILYFGVQSLMGMKMELTPEMELPMLVVGTVYVGASPQDVNDLITTKEEDAITSLDGVDTIQSFSQENISVVLVQYEYGTNMDTAYIDLKKEIDGIRTDLPDDIEEPIIMELDMNSQPIVRLAVSGQVGQNLYNYVDEKIVPELEKLSAVGEVSLSGGQKAYTRIELIPEKMDQYHLDMNTVAQLVAAADYTIPAGDIMVGRRNLDVSVSNDYESTESLKSVAIPLRNGNTVHLSDIANVYDALEDADSIGRYNGEDVISVGIKKQQSATAIEVSDQVMKQIPQLEARFPGIHFEVVNDSSDTIRESVANVWQTMVMAVILSMIILFLFYGDLRASVIIGTSIPISVVLALICMSAMGFSMNVISLTSMVLGVGMMVDNSINVLDGCFRAREKMNFYDAAIEGSRTMIGSITGGTITTCVVFLPLAVLSGMSGQLFKQLGFTIIFCLTASLFSAVTIVPLCYLQWHPTEKEQAPAGGMIRGLQNWYRKHMPGIIPRTGLVFGTALLLVVFAFFLAFRLQVELIGSVDTGIVDVTIKMRPGLSVEAINDNLEEIEAVVSADENVEHYLVTYGDSGMSIVGGSDVTLSAYLKDDASLSTEEMIKKWRKELQQYKDMSITLEEGSSTGAGSIMGGDEIEIDLQSTDYDALKAAADELATELRRREDVMQVHTSVENAAPVIKVKADPVKAEAEGLTPVSIGSMIYSHLSGIDAATIRVNGEDVDVKVEYAPDKYNSIEQLQSMMIPTASGTGLPLEDLAEIYYEDSPQQIERKDKQYQVAITMYAQAEYERTTENDVKAFVDQWDLPSGVERAPNTLDETMADEFADLAGALVTGIFLVFVVMSIQFESPKYSLMVMASIPFSLIGSFGLLWLVDSPISMVSLIGFLMLIGTVVNNGILYVDTVNQMLGNQMPLDEALVEAGAVRMRPILMTTLTTVISMLPNAFAYGKAGKMMQGLALVNIGGLTASTILILLLMPTFYRVVRNLGRKRYESLIAAD